MSSEPLDNREQPKFLRTLTVASLIGCALLLPLAWVLGYDQHVPVLAALAALMGMGVVFGWFGHDNEEADG